MRASDLLLAAPWRKASRSNNGASNCVEIAPLVGSGTAVRDSKNPNGPALVFDAGAWAAFLGTVKAGRLDI